jgi:hypothetical protein
MGEKLLSESLFFQANEENKQSIAQLDKDVKTLLERSDSLIKKLDEQGSPKSGSAKTEPVDKEKQKKSAEQFFANLQAAIAVPITPISKQIADLKQYIDNAQQPREIHRRISIQWVESKGVLTVVFLVFSLLASLLWGFSLKLQRDENENYYTMYRIIRANGGVSARQLEYVRTMVCTAGHEEKKAGLIKFADDFEERWYARQDSIINARENEKIQ